MSYVLIALAAILNALMDIVENENFRTSIFRNLNEKFWYKRESWKHARKIFGWKFDAWHVAKSGMIVCMALAVVLYTGVFPWWVDFLIFGAIWVVSFNLFYNKIFRK